MAIISDPDIALNNYLDNYNDGEEGLYKVVVQKGNVASNYVYAMQLLNNGSNPYVFRANKQLQVPFDKTPVLRLIYNEKSKPNTYYTAGGHTQTFEYANKKGYWFIGTKPKNKWATQIARVHIPQTKKIYNNTQMPRLSQLNYAGGFHINMTRVEAAVSPAKEYKYIMIASVDDSGNGYFSLYDLPTINTKLNEAEKNAKNGFVEDTSIKDINYVDSFMVEGITDLSNQNSGIGSIQGYDIDADNNIYISSQYSPTNGDHGKKREIVKIPWGKTKKSQWDEVLIPNNSVLDITGYQTELEGVQVIDKNDLYLTVAYHKLNTSSYDTLINRIYRVNW